MGMRMEFFINKICPKCKIPNQMVLLGDFSKVYKYKCLNCNAYFNDIDFEKEPLEEDALAILKEQKNKQPEKIETGKMKICGLASDSVYKGRFEKTKGLIEGPDMTDKQWMTFYWHDLITEEQRYLTMTYKDWIQFSKEITEAVARFEMEG